MGISTRVSPNAHSGIMSLIRKIKVNPEAELVSRISHAIQSWRLSTVREVVLSGFQLELYSPSERAFAYWYTSIVIDAHLTSLDEILKVISRGRSIRNCLHLLDSMLLQTPLLMRLFSTIIYL